MQQNNNNQAIQNPPVDPIEERFLRLERALHQTEQELINQRQINITMEQELNRQRQAASVPPPASSTASQEADESSSSFSQVRARAPDPFTGLDISLAPIFIHTLKQYINLAGNLDENRRVDLAITFFAYPANEWILAARANNEFPTLDALVNQFSIVYNINAENEVVDALDNLGFIHQAENQSVSDHYAKFLSLTYRAKTSKDVSTANQFLHSLRPTLKKAIIRDSSLVRTSLASVLTTALRHERALNVSRSPVHIPIPWVHQAPRQPRAPLPPRDPPPPRAPRPLPPANAPNLYGTAPGVMVDNPARNPNAMDVDAIRPRLTVVERQRREINRLCIICASPDHFRRDCPEAYHNRRQQQQPARIAAISHQRHGQYDHIYQGYDPNVDIRTINGWNDPNERIDIVDSNIVDIQNISQSTKDHHEHQGESSGTSGSWEDMTDTRSRSSNRSIHPASRSTSSGW